MTMRLKLRGKLVLVSLVLLLLPWFGVQYLQTVEELLQQQQAQSMATIAKASAVLVSDYPRLFKQREKLLQTTNGVAKTFVIKSLNPFQIDGYQDDWLSYTSRLKTMPMKNLLIRGVTIDPQDVSARYLVAVHQQSLNILLDVVDDSIVFRNPAKRQRNSGDTAVLAFVDQQQRVRRYLLSSSSFGKLNVYEYIGSYLDPVIIQQQADITAAWQKSAYGYRVELSLPMSMIKNEIALAIVDVDKGKDNKQVIGLGNVSDRNLFSTFLLPSEKLAKVLTKMAVKGVRLWLVDSKNNLFASAGQGYVVIAESQINSLIDFVYQLLFTPAVSDDESLSHEQSVLSSSIVDAALHGVAKTERRQTHANRLLTIVASQPILFNGTVKGVVVAEKNTNAILGLQNQAVKTLFQTTLLVFISVIIVLLGFASRLSFRIRRLNTDVSEAVSGDGRLSGQFKQRMEYDEVGELRQGFGNLLTRLGRYTEYLEALASRLAHELRTPIAVIRTSLEHLETNPDDKEVYIRRAREGSERINNIVARMSEASRLEQTVDSVSFVKFDLGDLLKNLMLVYQDIYPNAVIALSIDKQLSVIIDGSQDLIVQMMDKLISNAVDFHLPDTKIIVSLEKNHHHCFLTVKNTGIALPYELQTQLFQPMISARDKMHPSTTPHLGLGLYIVNLIVDAHHGKVKAQNWQQGVEIFIMLPI